MSEAHRNLAVRVLRVKDALNVLYRVQHHYLKSSRLWEHFPLSDTHKVHCRKPRYLVIPACGQ